jgi:hypothetical protein
MKKRTKKIQAQINFIAIFKMNPIQLNSDEVQAQIKAAKDLELTKLVDRFINAFWDLEEKVVEMKRDLAPYLPDDSDF